MSLTPHTNESSPSMPEPWAAGRTSVFELLSVEPGSALPEPDLSYWDAQTESRVYRSLEEIGSDLRIFRVTVRPRVASIPEGTGLVPIVIDLLNEASRGSTEAAAQLYLLLLDDPRTPFAVWPALGEQLAADGVRRDPYVGQLFAHWLMHAPDWTVVDCALFALARVDHSPPRHVLEVLGSHDQLAVGAASALARHHPDAESSFMAIARRVQGGRRARVLRFMREVTDPADRAWLLDEGYESWEYDSCALEAAVLGRLLDAMRDSLDEPVRFGRYVRVLGAMAESMRACNPSVADLEDYVDGPATVALVMEHIKQYGTTVEMREHMSNVLRCLSQFDGEVWDWAFWPREERARIASELRAALMPPGSDAELFWWERAEPTIANLHAGELDKLSRVIDNAELDGDLPLLVDWAERFLALDQAAEVANARREDLLGQEMPGVHAGGLAGFTDHRLSSVYGQVLLQVLHAMRGKARMGERLVTVGLESDMPHVPNVAREVVAGWEDEEAGDA
jgi:hypothetical protein